MNMKIKILLISAFLIGCASGPKVVEPNETIMQQLENDHSNGQISDDEFFTYLTYSVFAQDLLPKEYDGSVGKHDATPIIRKVQKAYPSLSKETQVHLSQWIKPLPPKPRKPGVRP